MWSAVNLDGGGNVAGPKGARRKICADLRCGLVRDGGLGGETGQRIPTSKMVACARFQLLLERTMSKGKENEWYERETQYWRRKGGNGMSRDWGRRKL